MVGGRCLGGSPWALSWVSQPQDWLREAGGLCFAGLLGRPGAGAGPVVTHHCAGVSHREFPKQLSPSGVSERKEEAGREEEQGSEPTPRVSKLFLLPSEPCREGW